MKKNDAVDVCIVGGGPAGMVLALLLSHHGLRTLVLEKNKDFEREYRGEVLMPRFTQMMRAIGLEEWLESLPHLKLKFGEIFFGSKRVGQIDFSQAAPDAPHALWIPQPVLLQALHDKAKAFPSYEIWFGAAAKHTVQSEGKVTGLLVQKDGEEIEICSRVVIGADGRYSTILKEGPFPFEYEDYKFDILWFTIPKPKNYENTFKVLLSTKKSVLLLPKFPDAIQAGILVAPHGLADLRKNGIDAMKKELKEMSPLFDAFADQMKDFTVFHPLQAHLHFVKEWATDGCLLIGDAAHCCSPAGAIGVSVAVGTAIVAADVLLRHLPHTTGVLPKQVLEEVQKIREPDVREIHQIQMRLTGGLLGSFLPVRWLLPLLLTLLAKTPFFTRVQKKLMALPHPLPIAQDLGL